MFQPTHKMLQELAAQHGTPVYIYSRAHLRSQAAKALAFRSERLTVRYAIKANPHPETLAVFDKLGLHVDCSSENEVLHALKNGVAADRIALNSQQLPRDMSLLEKGIFFTATSLHQLEQYGTCRPGTAVGVRLNPGFGSGASNRVTTGGRAAGFGIWHEYIPEVLALAKRFNLTISKVHTHIGAGTDPERWKSVASVTLDLARQFEEASCVSLGGGFKVGRMPNEVSADLEDIGRHIGQLLDAFETETSRKLHLEIEPGTFLTAGCGVLLSRVIDLTDTGKEGYRFIRLDTGMNDILRPTMYGALHPITVFPEKESIKDAEELDYVVIGHNCESGDLLTPAPGNSEELGPRRLAKASIGDLVVIGAAGAYCASMRAKGYNMFDEAPEVFVE